MRLGQAAGAGLVDMDQVQVCVSLETCVGHTFVAGGESYRILPPRFLTRARVSLGIGCSGVFCFVFSVSANRLSSAGG